MSKSFIVSIHKSADHETWEPVAVEDIPEWVRHPKAVARMLDGHALRNGHDPDSPYFIARRELMPEDIEAMAAAEAKRQKRMARNAARVQH